MTKRALILTYKGRKGISDRPACLLSSGGISVLERQLRQIAKLGIEEAYVCALNYTNEVEQALQNMRFLPKATVFVRSVSDIRNFEADDDDVLFLDDAMLLDDRLIKAVWHAEHAAALLVSDKAVAGDADLKLASGQSFAGVAKVPAKMVAVKSSNSESQTFLHSLLLSAAGEQRVALIHVQDMPLYIPDRRRDVPVLLHQVDDATTAKAGTEALIAMAQKGTLDWPAKYLHPFFENRLTRLLLNTPVTPNQVTLLTAVLGFGATYLFAAGYMAAALPIALILGVLDGVDGKLARTKMLTSRVGELEHIVDKVVEYSWYFAIAHGLTLPSVENPVDNAIYAVALLIVLIAWSEVVLSEFYRRLTGVQLDDAGDFERKFRLIGGRRNTFFWSLVPFAAMDAWFLGLWFLAFYSIATTFVAQWRFILRVRDYTSGLSPIIARNFRDSAYFPERKKSRN